MRSKDFLLRVMMAFGLAIIATQPLQATTAVLFDVQTGQVLHAENADKPWYPASLTKLMTAYVAFDVLRTTELGDQTILRLSEHANAQEPTKLWLRTDAEMTLATAIGAMIVKSANDAAVMVAEGVGGQIARYTRYGACLPERDDRDAARLDDISSPPHPMDVFASRRTGLGAARYDDATALWVACRYQSFVARMNATAKRIGMKSTTFVNANGLPDARQVTNARDLGLLARALIRDFPDYAPIFAARSMRYSGGRLRSYNALLRTYTGADGMKTGFICASGYNIVASATRNNRRLVAVVLGWSQASRRNTRAAALLEHGFKIAGTRFGPHDTLLNRVPSSGNEMVPPEDIRASLKSRSCRRGPGRRIRFRPRVFSVRTLEPPKHDVIPVPEKNAMRADVRPKPRRIKSKASRPVPKRVRRKKTIQKKARKKPVVRAFSAGAALKARN